MNIISWIFIEIENIRRKFRLKRKEKKKRLLRRKLTQRDGATDGKRSKEIHFTIKNLVFNASKCVNYVLSPHLN